MTEKGNHDVSAYIIPSWGSQGDEILSIILAGTSVILNSPVFPLHLASTVGEVTKGETALRYQVIPCCRMPWAENSVIQLQGNSICSTSGLIGAAVLSHFPLKSSISMRGKFSNDLRLIQAWMGGRVEMVGGWECRLPDWKLPLPLLPG